MSMHPESSRSIAATAMVILVLFSLVNFEALGSNALGASIDLFTQKEPYSGKGLDMPSDAFGPGEVVDLNALVILNDTPVQNLLVTFGVTTSKNTSFSLTSTTNSSGIAAVSFTIPTPETGLNESELFGTWKALANAMIGANKVQDTLTFEVNWIVQIISIRTINGNLTNRTIFGKGGDVGFEISLKSACKALRNVTIAITIQDELGVPVNFSEIDNFEVQPNGKLVFLYARARIPLDGPAPFIGNATATVSVLDAPANKGGTAYGPSESAVFFISPFDPIQVAFHDVAVVDIILSATAIQLGEPLDAEVVVNNEGTEVESFNASAYLGDTLIGTVNIYSLPPYSRAIVDFTINTSTFSIGNYSVAASIPPLTDEADLTDNILVDGTVSVRPRPPSFVHDIAITSVKLSNNSLHIGDTLQISIEVFNKGNDTETFSVTAYHNSSTIGTLLVNALTPTTQSALIFQWNTTSVLEGLYQITASAPLPDDIDTSDNTYVDGVVTITKRVPEPGPQPGPPFIINDLFIWLLFLLLILLLLLIVLLYRKAKRDEKRRRTRTSISRALPPCFGDTRIR